MIRISLLFLGLFFTTTVIAADHDLEAPGLKDTVILVIRHAEKPDAGSGLAPAGQERARAYVNYFKNFTFNGKPAAPDYLIATADSAASHRPYLTLEPLSQATGMAIDNRFKDRQFKELADDIRSKPHGKVVLICWHHGEIPELLKELGASPEQLLPNGKWPPEVFGWIVELRYDSAGHLAQAKTLNEDLMPDDKIKAMK